MENLATIGTHRASLQTCGLMLDLFFVAGRQALEILMVGLVVSTQDKPNIGLHQYIRNDLIGQLTQESLSSIILPEWLDRLIDLPVRLSPD